MLRVGIAGLGAIGQAHLRGYRQLGDLCRAVAVADARSSTCSYTTLTRRCGCGGSRTASPPLAAPGPARRGSPTPSGSTTAGPRPV